MTIASSRSIPDIASRQAAYAGGNDPVTDLNALYDRLESDDIRPVWIDIFTRAQAKAMLSEATARKARGETLPLYGIPFAIKDNIDVAGLPTTAACPEFAYRPERSATVVERLLAAGAIPIGKTNLDQFATGLNGTRSPYGIPASVFDAGRVSGGSSSGSAVAVAAGLVPFALGTDTAGSGRVPAGFNNIVGLKPTRGLLSARGMVPACRTLDCVSIFANTVADALTVARIAAGFDVEDAWSREAPAAALDAVPASSFRFGVPGDASLAICDTNTRAAFARSADALERLGGARVTFDFAPFAEAASLLYSGPWVAERLAAIAPFAADHADAIHPAVRDVILSGERYSAVDAFTAQYALADLQRRAAHEWARMDVMLLPTAPGHPTIAAMLADPIGQNTALGAFTNFVNLMDLSALAVPAGFGPDGLPAGVTLVGPAFADGRLAAIGDDLHRAVSGATMGASGVPLPPRTLTPAAPVQVEAIDVAVVGAHLAGQPLNWQLTERGGTLVKAARTAPGYSLYALAGTMPAKPGLVCDGGAGGIELEVWRMPIAGFGALVADIPAPLGIGTITLADGTTVKSFLCETRALADARDITAFGGWRAFLASAEARAA